MDKQKQIEEMAIQEMARIFIKASCKGSECENCLFIDSLEEAKQCCVCLKAFYKAGYRKLPEGSVVLSKEEWEEKVDEFMKQERKITELSIEIGKIRLKLKEFGVEVEE